jgi:hypothetical protein
MPAFLLHGLGGGLADELLLTGQRVLPDKADAHGFKFRHETLPSALAAMLGGRSARESGGEFVVAPDMPPAEIAAPVSRVRHRPIIQRQA